MKDDDAYKHAGTIGDMGVFSFFPTKTLGGYGDGGMIVTNSDELNDMCRMMRIHGASKKYHYDYVGYNSRLDVMQVAVLRVKLKYMNDAIVNRARIAKLYTKKLSGFPQVKVQGIKQPQQNVYYVSNIFAENGDGLVVFLNSKRVATSICKPKPLHLEKCFEYLGYKDGQFQLTEAMCKKYLHYLFTLN